MRPAPESDIVGYNRSAWNVQVERKNRWTVPVTSGLVEQARQGKWEIVLTPSKPVPREWFPDFTDCSVLCLAGGGGQQGPLLAAAGATVTVYDNSEKQLGQDQKIAEREGLDIQTIRGDMARLDALQDRAFDLIVHPCSNTFVPEIRPVWQEAFRVLKPGGHLLSGFCNPLAFIFDETRMQAGELVVRHRIPYSDQTDLTAEEKNRLMQAGEPFCFGHSLEDQLAGQMAAGFTLTGLYEDYWHEPDQPLDRFIASFLATRATKPL